MNGSSQNSEWCGKDHDCKKIRLKVCLKCLKPKQADTLVVVVPLFCKTYSHCYVDVEGKLTFISSLLLPNHWWPHIFAAESPVITMSSMATCSCALLCGRCGQLIKFPSAWPQPELRRGTDEYILLPHLYSPPLQPPPARGNHNQKLNISGINCVCNPFRICNIFTCYTKSSYIFFKQKF